MTDSDNLELKKRARRRLVGAAALALLAAIVLPMVMDHEPGSPAQDIQVSIPDRDADSALARPIAGRDEPASEPQIAPPPEEAAPVVGGSDVAAVGSPKVSNPEPVTKSAGAVPTASSKPSEAPKATPESTQKIERDEAARARALLENKPIVPNSDSEAFVVQVGAFGEAGAAGSVSTDLKKKGFSAYTEKAGAVTRVRVGPFSSREEAEKVVGRLRAAGINGVVAPR